MTDLIPARGARSKRCRLGVRVESSRPSSPSTQICGSVPPDGVGDGLRRMFDDVVAAPMPSTLLDLCEALEDAFHRGALSACRGGKPNG